MSPNNILPLSGGLLLAKQLPSLPHIFISLLICILTHSLHFFLLYLIIQFNKFVESQNTKQGYKFIV